MSMSESTEIIELKYNKMKKVVIKYGGNAMTDENIRKQIFKVLIESRESGVLPVLIHGGGPMLNDMFAKVDIKSEFIDGLRCTDENSIDIVVQILAGKVNKSVVSEIQSLGGKAVGISGADGSTIIAEPFSGDKRLGYVGKVKLINSELILAMINAGYIPVISTVGYSVDGKPYNINADMVAGHIAEAIGAEQVIFMTAVDGLYMDFNDKESLIENISVNEALELIENKIITGGMIPKLKSCIEAIELGARESFIINGEKPEILEALLADIAFNKNQESEFKYYTKIRKSETESCANSEIRKPENESYTKFEKSSFYSTATIQDTIDNNLQSDNKTLEFESYKNKDGKYIVNTYTRYPVLIEYGKGSICRDNTGKEYIDFTSGIGVNSFGFADDEIIRSVSEQMKSVSHTSNLFYTKPMIDVAERIIEKSGMSKVFFCNSGAEANEVAIKAARKYYSMKYSEKTDDSNEKIDCEMGLTSNFQSSKPDENRKNKYPEIITLKNSFHGRTMATITATGQENYHKYFDPFLEGFKYATANDIDSINKCISDNTVAIMIELIQGEGGVMPLNHEFVKDVERICREHDILLIIDEVQTGAGRCGAFLCSQLYDVKPDIVTMAKGIGGGLPVGACIFGKKTENAFKAGDHGTTFGANPAILAGTRTVLNRMNNDFFDSVKRKGDLIKNTLMQHQNILEDITGEGMMIGFNPKLKSASDVVREAMELGVLVLTAKDRVRLLPPLNIAEKDLLRGLELLVKACEKQV